MDESGNITNFAVELPSPTLMSRGVYRWARSTFKPGDVVTFLVHPSRTGAPEGLGRGCEDDGCGVLINDEKQIKHE